MPDESIDPDGTLVHTAVRFQIFDCTPAVCLSMLEMLVQSWDGFEFMRMKIPKVEERLISEAPSLHKRPWTMRK